MKIFHFYHEETGLFHDGSIGINVAEGHEDIARRNAPPGHKAIEGMFDRLSQRVDVTSGAVVEYQPPQPSVDHVWDAAHKRWLLSDVAAQRNVAREAAQAQILELERQSVSPMRALLLNPQDAEARPILAAIDAQINALRGQL